jgi:SAM-dependent methyltransferase
MEGTAGRADRDWQWECLSCRAALVAAGNALTCAGCGQRYPAAEQLPILVAEPAAYVRGELALLTRAIAGARQRHGSLEEIARTVGLPSQSTDRHRDVIEAEIERTEVFHSLIASLAKSMGDEQPELRGARRPAGWSLDALLPYLLRDWTGAPEFEALAERIGTAVGSMFPQACDKSLVFAACGAAGLLTRVGAEFGRVLGFDLALPILGAARHLLDGQTLELRLPRAVYEPSRIRLGEGRLEPASRNVRLVAMDALDTALPAGSVDCFVTTFMTDLLPEPRRLALEIHRALRDGGIWINYGPSGPLTALWRFDQPEAAGFMANAGFLVLASAAHRTTYLDLTVHCPAWSFQNHVCYLTTARKSGQPRPVGAAPAPRPSTAPRDLVPRHFPGAAIVERRGLGDAGASSTIFRHDGARGRPQSWEIGPDAARILALVDGKRTAGTLADELEREAGQTSEQTLRVLARWIEEGLLRAAREASAP